MRTATPWRMLALVTVLAVALGGLMAGQAQADGRTVARVLAGLAVGALVYEALDNDHGSRHCAPTRDPYPRYNPPSNRYNRNSPRENYDEGYGDGFGDGRDYGRREGYNTGYSYGYRDGREDQWVRGGSRGWGAPSRSRREVYRGRECW
jgi:hypothetical protein